jgi:hypothetical protein
MVERPYRFEKAVAYAEQWALGRNPAYADFSELGGDCTNFVSQCVFAGSGVMNPTPEIGWYYYGLERRSASWAGVEYFYDFMIRNQGVGPYAVAVPLMNVKPGDVIQLGNSERFYHSLFVLGRTYREVYVAAHTQDALWRELSSYSYQRLRCLHFPALRAYA